VILPIFYRDFLTALPMVQPPTEVQTWLDRLKCCTWYVSKVRPAIC